MKWYNISSIFVLFIFTMSISITTAAMSRHITFPVNVFTGTFPVDMVNVQDWLRAKITPNITHSMPLPEPPKEESCDD